MLNMGKEHKIMAKKTKNEPEFPVPSAQDILPVVISAPEVIFADIETTGFGRFSDIIEIGAVRLEVESGRIIGKFSSFCRLKLQNKVPKKITELTGITSEMLAEAPRLEVVLNAFQKFVGTTPMSFHNAVFDWPMLGEKYLLIGRRLPNRVICTKKLFTYLHPDMPANLEAVTRFYGQAIEGSHRAYVDCKWAAACFRKMRLEVIQRMSDQPSILPLDLSASEIDAPDIEELSYDELAKICFVYRITGWKKGKKVRIYCTTSVADFFYDMADKGWNVSKKKISQNLNVETLAQLVLDRMGLSLAQFQERYRPA